MGGYLSTDDSWSVSDAAQGGYTGTVTGTLSVTAGTGTSCSWSASVSHPSYNFFKIYIAIDGTCVKDEYVKISNTKSSYFSGTADISGDDVSITFGLSASVNSTSTDYMSFKTGTLTRKKWTDVKAGSVAIRDNDNNSFTVTCTSGTTDTSNPITAQGMWVAQYKYSDGSWMWSAEDKTKLEQTIALGGLTNSNQRHVAGFLRSYATYGNNADASNTAWINQYRPPSNPTNVHLDYTKSRLTVKEMWTLKWDANNLAANTTSPVKGFRIRMQVNGVYRPILDAYYRQLSSQSGTDYYYDTENTLTSLDIWPGVNGINPGDKVRFNIFAYSKNGLGEITWSVGENKYSLWSGSGTSPAESPIYEVQNAGVVHVKVDGQWKEGIVHVKVNGQWKEADVVYTKVGGTWEESE